MIKGGFLAGVLLAVFAALAVSSALHKSATWDETHYLGIGVYLSRHLKWDIPSVSLHPPLSYYLSSILLQFCNLRMDCIEKGEAWDILSGVRRGQCLLRHSEPSGDRLLLLSRIPTVALGILLGCFVYLWSSRLHGTGGGILSLFLYCLNPDILAHTQLITPDLPLTAFGFIAIYYFWKETEEGSHKNRILCGFFLGLALLSKYSALIWIPIIIVLTVLIAVSKGPAPSYSSAKGSSKIPLGSMAIILLVAIIVTFLGYGFQISHYWLGIQAQEKIIGEGFPAFLNGTVSWKGGWWYYYLLAFLMKAPLPTLLILLWALAVWKMTPSLGRFRGICLLLPVVMFFGILSMFHKVNVGLRYVLPIYPFLFVLAGSMMLLWNKRRFLWAVAMVPLLLWQAYENLSVYPHYLAYFNQLVGGPKNGYRHLVDSNLDWGQDLKGLKAYMDEKGLQRIKLSYFGSADPGQYGIDCEVLPSFVRLSGGRAPTPLKKGDMVAVSATNLYPLYVDLGELSEHLRSISPVAHVGYSILIYRIGRDF